MSKGIIKPKIWAVLYLYWAVLLAWQNLRSVGNRSGLDIVIKIVLILGITIVFVCHSRRISIKSLFVALGLMLVSLSPAIAPNTINLTDIIYYFYPILMYFLVFVIGNDLTITKKELICFCKVAIFTIWYIVLYAILFCTDQFLNAFSISDAYGNELCSFLVSNMEYGMYLSFGIFFCLLCMELEDGGKYSKAFYGVTIAVFAINLVLTFSRTSIIATAVILLSYLFFGKKSRYAPYFIAVAVLLAAAVTFSETIGDFVTNIVFKGNTDAGRNDLFRVGMRLYSENSFVEKLVGMNQSAFTAYVKRMTSHSDLHNAYIQRLLTNGAVGLTFLVGVMVSIFITIWKAKKKHPEHIRIISLFLGFTGGAAVFMLTTTGALLESTIDSFFLTISTLIIPKYVCNAMDSGTFDPETTLEGSEQSGEE